VGASDLYGARPVHSASSFATAAANSRTVTQVDIPSADRLLAQSAPDASEWLPAHETSDRRARTVADWLYDVDSLFTDPGTDWR
jgi:hypothetical protein